jgi:hypothetical protein
MIKRIHVHTANMRANKDGGNRPTIIVREGRRVLHCHAVEIKGPSRMVYSPGRPLSSGAVIWLETTADVVAYVAEVGVA